MGNSRVGVLQLVGAVGIAVEREQAPGIKSLGGKGVVKVLTGRVAIDFDRDVRAGG